MQLGGRHRPLRKGLEALAQKAIRIQQHLVTKEHVVDADDARFLQLLLRRLLVRHGLVDAVWRRPLMWAMRHGVLALCWRCAAVSRAHRDARAIAVGHFEKEYSTARPEGVWRTLAVRASQPRAR